MGIKDFTWTLDRSGNPHAMSGLQIRAIDLARVGQMMLDEGSWKGRQIVSKGVGEAIDRGEPGAGSHLWLALVAHPDPDPPRRQRRDRSSTTRIAA